MKKKSCINRILLVSLLLFSIQTIGWSQISLRSDSTISNKQAQKLVDTGDTATLSKLFAQGLDINKTYYRLKYTLLHMAAYDGQFVVAKYLVAKGADPNVRDAFKHTPLLISSSSTYRNDSISTLLIKNKADLNAVGEYGSTALRNSINIFGKPNAYLFKLLIENGADYNYECDECCNRSIFLYTCGYGNTEMLQLLLDKKVNVDQTDCHGLNGLMCAIETHNLETIDLLLTTSIDLNHKDEKSLTAMDYATASKEQAIIDKVSLAMKNKKP